MHSNQQKQVNYIIEQLQIDIATISPEILQHLYAKDVNLIDIEDILDFIKEIGLAIQAPEQTAILLEKVEDETSIIVHKLKFISVNDRPNILVLEDLNPLKINDSIFLNECIKIAGGIPTNELEKANKIIVLNDSTTVIAQIPNLIANHQLATSKAIELDQVFIINKNEFAQNPGVNYLEELETLSEIIQPKYFVYGHEGSNWMQFQLA